MDIKTITRAFSLSIIGLFSALGFGQQLELTPIPQGQEKLIEWIMSDEAVCGRGELVLQQPTYALLRLQHNEQISEIIVLGAAPSQQLATLYEDPAVSLCFPLQIHSMAPDLLITHWFAILLPNGAGISVSNQ